MDFRRLLIFVSPHYRILIGVVVLLLLGSGLSLIKPWLGGQMTAAILTQDQDSFRKISEILAAWLAVIVIGSALGLCSSYMIGSAGEVMLAKLRRALFKHIQYLPQPYYADRQPGATLSLLSNDAEIVGYFVTHTVVRLLPLSLSFFGALVLIAMLSPLIASLTLLFLPVYYILMKFVGRRIRPIAAQWTRAWSDAMSYTDENIRLLPAIKAFTREPEEIRRFAEKNNTLLSVARKDVLIHALLDPAVAILGGLGLIGLLWLGTHQVEQGLLTPPELVTLLLYAMMLNSPLSSLADVYGKLMRAKGASERIIGFLSLESEEQNTNAPALPAVAGSISFKGISFSYPDRAPLLQDFNLEIPAGETLAIVGENGAGKSTLAHLLLRFIDPQIGLISIDGFDISRVNLVSVRDQIGLVAQHTLLVNGSISDNIAYGEVTAAHSAIEQAARSARAHDFIAALPQGYGTIVGDQGLKLSGGQRQRIALARALLKDPPIMILDEATSMFDPSGEEEFLAQCAAMFKDKTVILITHRPASLALADRILRLEPVKTE